MPLPQYASLRQPRRTTFFGRDSDDRARYQRYRNFYREGIVLNIAQMITIPVVALVAVLLLSLITSLHEAPAVTNALARDRII